MENQRDWLYYSELYEHLTKHGFNDGVAVAILAELGKEARHREMLAKSGGATPREDDDADDAGEVESRKGRAHPADVKLRAQELMDDMLEFVELVNRS